MTPEAQEEPGLPVWARQDAFPASPGGFGWVDFKNHRHTCPDRDSLLEVIREDSGAGVALVWEPRHSHMILPEELDEAGEAVLAARKRRAVGDLADAIDRLRWFGMMLGILTLYLLYKGWVLAPGIASPAERALFSLRAVISSLSIGITLLMFLIFAFIPWYQSRKRLRQLAHWRHEDLENLVPSLRFETWLDWQKAPVTRFLLVLVSLVGLAQLIPGNSLMAAGLIKESYLRGEWWRLFTAPFLHGNLLHFLMNAAALLYLGKRLEVFARWPHVPLVFLFAACVGGEASARLLAAPSVGASGGLMGWLGFLLVFESLHSRLIPRRARRRLVAGVLLTALIGLIGYRFIDNAAHGGGLLAGMLYAAIVFPRSASALRPRATSTDRIAGALSLAALTAAAAFAVSRILAA